MARSSWFASIAFLVTVLVLLALASSPVSAQSNDPAKKDGRLGPVYQRRAFETFRKHDDRRRHPRHRFHAVAPPVSSGWFQRPYPYHLDYYRMKYGGSYAPYFGNLYGPPQVVVGPPYVGPPYGDGYLWPYGADGAHGPALIEHPNHPSSVHRQPMEEIRRQQPREPDSEAERLSAPPR